MCTFQQSRPISWLFHLRFVWIIFVYFTIQAIIAPPHFKAWSWRARIAMRNRDRSVIHGGREEWESASWRCLAVYCFSPPELNLTLFFLSVLLSQIHRLFFPAQQSFPFLSGSLARVTFTFPPLFLLPLFFMCLYVTALVSVFHHLKHSLASLLYPASSDFRHSTNYEAFSADQT